MYQETRNIILKLFVSAVGILFLLGVSTTSVSAQSVENTWEREFQVSEDYVQITEEKSTSVQEPGFSINIGSSIGFTIFSPLENDPDRVEKSQRTLDSLVVTDLAGRNLEYEISEQSDGNYEVRVISTQRVGFGDSFNVGISYRSYGLLWKTGAVTDLFIPGLPEDYDISANGDISTIITVPKNYRELNFSSSDVFTQSPKANSTQYIYPSSEFIGTSLWLQFGRQQFFEFDISQQIPATSNFPFGINRLEVVLPRDIQSGTMQQSVFVSRIEPQPFRSFEDEDGNIILEYVFSSSEELNIQIEGYGTIDLSGAFSILSAGSITDYSVPIDDLLKPAEYWEVDHPDIQAAARSLKGDSEDVGAIIQRTYEFVIDRVDYSFVKKNGLNDRQGALKTLNGGAAVCMEYSDLFIALLRAQGVPARAAFGYGFGTSDFDAREDETINHQWAEVLLPNSNRWVPIDITWGEFGSSILGGDLNHFYSHVSSLEPNSPSLSSITFTGDLGVLPDRVSNIRVVEDFSVDPSWQSIDDILETFPSDSSLSFSERLSIQSDAFDQILYRTFQTENQTLIHVIKFLFFISPVLIFVVVFLLYKLVSKGDQPVRQKLAPAQPQNITRIPEY